MIPPQPISEHAASEDIRKLYGEIKASFDITYVPMMFRYLANYPALFENLWESIHSNLEDPIFDTFIRNITERLISSTEMLVTTQPNLISISRKLIPDEDRHKVAHEIEKYFRVQLQLALIAIAIRERTKGWAIGARALTDVRNIHTPQDKNVEENIHEDLRDTALAELSSALAQHTDISHSLMKYIVFIHEEFADMLTRDEYLFARVATEKLFGEYVTQMPHPIFASYNEVSKSVHDSRELPYLFYLLSEKFPVSHAISALMWGMSLKVLED